MEAKNPEGQDEAEVQVPLMRSDEDGHEVQNEVEWAQVAQDESQAVRRVLDNDQYASRLRYDRGGNGPWQLFPSLETM